MSNTVAAEYSQSTLTAMPTCSNHRDTVLPVKGIWLCMYLCDIFQYVPKGPITCGLMPAPKEIHPAVAVYICKKILVIGSTEV